MKNTAENTLFGPSGCLSREGLSRFARGKLSVQELTLVKAHLQTCEFCTLAAEGMAMADPQEFDQDLAAIFASLKEVNVEVAEEELVSEFAEAEMQQSNPDSYRDRTQKKALKNQEVKKTALPQKSFSVRYRLELIAAAILLLLAIGARQIYVGLSPEKQPQELAHFEPEDVGEMQVIQEEITRSGPLAEERLERKPTPLEPVQIAAVSDNREYISAPAAEPANKSTQGTVDSDAIQNENNASGGVMHMQHSVEEEEEVEIFTVVEDAPEFPGGDKKRIEFLAENIKYPNEAREFGVQGTVYVGFVVEKDGSIRDPRVLRGIGGGCDEETLRAIRLMPKWKPGIQRGKPVRVRITLPVMFSFG